jgi:hypothetical protein
MPKELEKPLTADRVFELWELFGEPPVLSSENLDSYHKLISEYIFHYQPTNALQLRAIREMLDADWEMARCSRHRTVMVERYFRKEADELIFRLQKSNEPRKREIESIKQYGRDETKKHQLETLIHATETNIAKIRQAHGNELDHNRILQQGAPFLDRLDDWQNSARARRAGAMQLLEYSLARPAMDEQRIIDAQYQEVEKQQIQPTVSPSIAPAEAPVHDVSAENSSEQAELSKE